MPDPLLTLDEMCAKYHVSNRRARDIIKQHNIPVLHPGRKFLFDEQAEVAFREATRLNTDRSPPADPPRDEARPVRSARAGRAYDRVMRVLEDKAARQHGLSAGQGRKKGPIR